MKIQIDKKSLYIVIALLSASLSIFLLALLLSYCLAGLLGDTDELRNHVEISSPNQNTVVDVFNIYGGATSVDFTQIVIRPRNEWFDSRNNFLVFSIEGIRKTKVTWVTDALLEIQYQSGVVYCAAPQWNEVHIAYSELP